MQRMQAGWGAAIVAAASVFATSASGQTTERVSVTAGGGDATGGGSLRPAASYDGTVVAFASSATDLVSGDTNEHADVYVRNRITDTTERLPVPVGFDVLDADWVTISHDGRFIAYNRGASFLYDRFNGTTQTVSAATPGSAPVAGAQPRVSASGRYVAFLTNASFDQVNDTNGTGIDVYRFDRITGAQVLVSRATGGAAAGGTSPTISADGRLVAFVTFARLTADDTNDVADVYLRNIDAQTTIRLSTNVPVPPVTEARDPFISADGRYVSYLLSLRGATNEETAKSDVYVVGSDGSGLRGPLNGTTEGASNPLAPCSAEGQSCSYDPTLSMFGRFLTFRS
jgi:Tol biopolymer transport system component